VDGNGAHERGGSTHPASVSSTPPRQKRAAGTPAWCAPRASDRYAGGDENKIHATSRIAVPTT
jgi:hypothetical protein